MPLQQAGRFLRQNLPFYLTGFLVLLTMKYFNSRAGAQELQWLLGPTAGWVTLVSGIPFEYIAGEGYVNHSLRIIIAPSCSGMQFMLITGATLLFSFVHRAAGNGSRTSRLRKGFLWTGCCFLLSYLAAIFVNGLRIIAAIYLPAFLARAGTHSPDSPAGLFWAGVRSLLPPDKLHTAIGILVYFFSLLTIYRLGGYFFRKTDLPQDIRNSTGSPAEQPMTEGFLRKCLPPLFWYFAFVLGIPLLNHVVRKNGPQFASFAALTAACCGTILFLYLLAMAGHRIWQRRKNKS